MLHDNDSSKLVARTMMFYLKRFSSPSEISKTVVLRMLSQDHMGEYGLCATNPIPVRGIAANEVYLNQIELENGDPIQWCRLGSTIANNINGCIDMYTITTLAGDNVCTLYISPYQNTISGIAPKGFRIKSEQ